MYDRILLPTDGSEEMEYVIEHAVSLATTHGATVQGLYVVDTGRFASLPVGNSWEGVTQMLREEGELALDELEAYDAGSVGVEGHMVEGDPTTEILRYADEADCDVIVMGTHGRGGIDRLLLGSVAERVIRQSHVPVVTVPVRRGEQREEPPSSVRAAN
ncbi:MULTISPECIES: universal stress protein [Haloarcula]|uniref:universal stress protein n=1 Tax=Haloarcula TaxID=2237 RepID=UPI0023EC4B28|nr:universal stress protein [Halomicroarcula sp. XH51]